MCEREQRGLAIAALSKIVKKGNAWIVPSQSGDGTRYTVIPDEDCPHCSCPDHEARGGICKHLFAVRFVMKREQNPDGTETVTETMTIAATVEKRKTYRQDWPNYNAAQVNEKKHFQSLLRDLCDGIPNRIQVGKGQRAIPRCDAIFSAVFKVYSGFSARRFMTDLTEAHSDGHISKLPCYNSVLNYLESEEVTPILHDLIVRAAMPLRSLESHFSIDSTGFSSSKFCRWFDHKYGKMHTEHQWLKAHVSTGVNTHVVAAVEITDKFAQDSPMFEPLFNKTNKNFEIKELSADKAYSSINSIGLINAIGADSYIAFKSVATGYSGGIFAKAFHYFQMYREEFLQRYHQRSNVESAISMIKRKFGDSVRAKTDVAMRNEVLCKILCHNICCLISAMYELGIEPNLIAG